MDLKYLLTALLLSGLLHECINTSTEWELHEKLESEISTFNYISDSVQIADSIAELKPLSIISNQNSGIEISERAYVSLATYWWPDPGTESGLPYIRIDGEVNPETSSEISDLPRLIEMSQRVESLAEAFRLTGEERFAKAAISQLNLWFVDDESSMYPHLEHAQMIRGRDTGRSYGVIDTWWLVRVVESYDYLEKSEYWTPEIDTGLKSWFTHYLNWLRNSEFGKKEKQSRNNHGTWYDLQVVTYARFIGQKQFARDYLNEITKERIPQQITRSGRQKHETRRPRPLHYSIYNLNGLIQLAVHGRQLGVDLTGTDSRFSGSLKDALIYLLRQMETENVNPAELIIENDHTETDRLYQQLLINSLELFNTENCQVFKVWARGTRYSYSKLTGFAAGYGLDIGCSIYKFRIVCESYLPLRGDHQNGTICFDARGVLHKMQNVK